MKNFIQVKQYGATVYSRIHIDHIITYTQQTTADGTPGCVRIILTSGITFIAQAIDAEIDAKILEAQR